MPCKILILEDDAAFGTILRSWFVKNGFDTVLTSRVEQAKTALQKDEFDLLLTDLRLPDGDGIMLLSWIREQHKTLPVIVMTSYADVQSAVAAIKLGAFDYLEKPVSPSILKEKVEQALHGAAPAPLPAALPKKTPACMVDGKSRAARLMLEQLQLVAPTRLSVLLLGESGTGKEFAARRIHELSPRAAAPFIAVDCGSLSRELAPSELFGHLKGSFTTAIADKKGVFEQAAGGTVFLDEVGNLSYEVQVQLLRTLQERKVRRVGAAVDIPVDVRLVAATNERLEQAIAAGRFREDLYHRLNEFVLSLPPLRERTDDIPVFVDYFLREANEELGKMVSAFSPEALKVLAAQSWNGNLRELRNVVRRAVLFACGTTVLPDHLPFFPPAADAEAMALPPKLRQDNELQIIEEALRKTGGNKTEAARLLGVDRKTLYNKMHLYGMIVSRTTQG